MKPINRAQVIESGIIESFSKHAASYDRHAHLQKSMAERLASMLPETFPERVIELGCGTGVFTRHLLAHPLRVLSLNDIALAMIQRLQKSMPLPPNTEILVGNAESIVFPKAGLIVANAVFQWFLTPEKTLKRLHHVLLPGGNLVFSTFGPRTLEEFRNTLSLQSPTLLYSLEQWKTMLWNAGFEVRESHAEVRKTFTDSTLALMRNLQQIGAAPFRMIGSGGVKKLIREYDAKFNTAQGVYAHWEIYYFSAVPKHTPDLEDPNNI